MSVPDQSQPSVKKPLASLLPSLSSRPAQTRAETVPPATIGGNGSRPVTNGIPPLQDPTSVGATTKALEKMSVSPIARQNGLAGGETSCPVTTSPAPSALHAYPPAPSAEAVASKFPPQATSANSGATCVDRFDPLSTMPTHSTLSDGAPVPVKVDPRSVAAHVALPGDEKAIAAPSAAAAAAAASSSSSSSHTLGELVMGKTLGTGTFGRVRLVRAKRNGEFYALKIMTIQEVVRLKQIEHVRSEKNILQKINHPFIVDLKWTHHDTRFLYMLLEFVVGGELFSYLRAVGRFHTGAASFYAAEIVSALDHLHSHSIIYRDLKPENLLIDGHGHIKITDFGFAKELSQDNYTWTLCGTPEYLAPEIIQNRGHGKAVDWWALGILIYEMLVGYPPFFDDTAFGIYEKILSGAIDYPRFLESPSRDIIKKLLVGDRTKRLGSMRGGTEDVKKHRFFRDYDFQKLREHKCKPPFVPTCPSSPADYASNFDDYEEEDLSRVARVTPHDLAFFSDF